MVSVVVPVHEGERFLAGAVDSVLAQDYPGEIETIVVDDGSTDGSAAIALGRPVTYVRQRRSGVAAARNAGIERARGDVLAFLDQDDAWTPDKLSVQVRALEQRPAVDFVLAHMQVVLEPGTPRPGWLPAAWLDAPLPGTLPGTLVARRRAFEAVGPFDAAFELASDLDWFARAKDLGVDSHLVPEILLLHRFHGGNATYRRADARAELFRAVHASVHRQRAAALGRRRLS